LGIQKQVWRKILSVKLFKGTGVVYASNPSTWEAKAGR
jgi:hypothetical protein